MNHARYIALMLCLDWNTIAVVTHCDDGILQIRAAASVDHVCQLVVNLFVCQVDASSDMLERGAGIISDFFLRDDAAVNLILQRSQWLKICKICLQAVLDFLIVLGARKCLGSCGTCKGSGNL